jgi:hypothetical protein
MVQYYTASKRGTACAVGVFENPANSTWQLALSQNKAAQPYANRGLIAETYANLG